MHPEVLVTQVRPSDHLPEFRIIERNRLLQGDVEVQSQLLDYLLHFVSQR